MGRYRSHDCVYLIVGRQSETPSDHLHRSHTALLDRDDCHDARFGEGFKKKHSIKNWNIYLWGNDFLKDHPRVVVGVDFAL